MSWSVVLFTRFTATVLQIHTHTQSHDKNSRNTKNKGDAPEIVIKTEKSSIENVLNKLLVNPKLAISQMKRELHYAFAFRNISQRFIQKDRTFNKQKMNSIFEQIDGNPNTNERKCVLFCVGAFVYGCEWQDLHLVWAVLLGLTTIVPTFLHVHHGRHQQQQQESSVRRRTYIKTRIIARSQHVSYFCKVRNTWDLLAFGVRYKTAAVSWLFLTSSRTHSFSYWRVDWILFHTIVICFMRTFSELFRFHPTKWSVIKWKIVMYSKHVGEGGSFFSRLWQSIRELNARN